MTRVPPLPEVDVRAVWVPLERALSVSTGPVVPETVEALETQGFDQAPVFAGDRCIGVAPTAHLRALLDTGTPLTADDPAVRCPSVAETAIVHIGDLLGAFAGERAILLLGDEGEPIGMVTISDLNRHAVRKALYDLLADVEARLATLLDRTLKDKAAMLRHLGDRDQIDLLGHYHFMQSKGVELSLLAGATLSQLLRLAENHAPTLELLGYRKTAFKDQMGSMPEVRNAVMHPVRPLIYQPEQVTTLLGRVERLNTLRGALDRVHAEESDRPLL